MTHFERLGLAPSFVQQADEIEHAYLARSREVHPDFHQQGSSAEQRASMESSAALNEAYATLKQPFRRAEYLLGLFGGPSAAEHKSMAPAFLEEMLELRMEIEELRSDRDAESAARQKMAQRLTDRNDKLVEDLASRFGQVEALPAGDAKRQPILRQIRQTLNAAKYIQGLLRDLNAD